MRTQGLPPFPPVRADPPPPDASPVAVRVRPEAERAIRDGHPWLFASGVRSQSRDAAAGTTAVVFDRKDRFLAAGLLDPEGPIRVRLLVHGRPARIGPELFRARWAAALERRAGILDERTTGARLLHGENDGVPGVVADRYGDSLVLKIYTTAWLPHLQALLDALPDASPDPVAPERVVLLGSGKVLDAEGAFRGAPALRQGLVLRGAPMEGPLPFLESGLRFEAHPVEGHKTGFYLDQRENRRRLEREATGGRVLNVFAHTGAFSLYAARGGAGEVTSVDVSGPALAQADRHFALNGDDPRIARCRHRTLEGDAFAWMERLGRNGERFAAVVIDPPSFAKAATHVGRALESYARLTRLALPLLEPGGLLVQASCSSRIGDEAFFSRVLAAARDGGGEVREIARTGHPPDHPIGFPEGAYLKCLWARVRSSEPPATGGRSRATRPGARPRPGAPRGRGRAGGGSASEGRS